MINVEEDWKSVGSHQNIVDYSNARYFTTSFQTNNKENFNRKRENRIKSNVLMANEFI